MSLREPSCKITLYQSRRQISHVAFTAQGKAGKLRKAAIQRKIPMGRKKLKKGVGVAKKLKEFLRARRKGD